MTGIGRTERGIALGNPHAQLHWGRMVLRAAVTLALSAGLIWLLGQRLAAIEPEAVLLAMRELPLQSWVLAGLFTALSFWAVGQYDAVIHRHLATGLPETRARRAGVCAISVSQMIGMGVISGAILRWRMLPQIGLWQAVQLTAAVALSFLGAWVLVTSTVLLVLPDAPFKALAALGFSLSVLVGGLSGLAPRLGRFSLRWPNLFTQSRLVMMTVVDTFAAAAAFLVLCPPELGLDYATLLPVFLLALGAGLVSGAPGGMGAFEMTAMALLPLLPQAELVAAVLAWRMIYFALPAILGAAWAIKGPGRAPARLALRPNPAMLRSADAAEVQIHAQGEHALMGQDRFGLWLGGRTAHCLVGLFQPVSAPQGPLAALRVLRRLAAQDQRAAVLYKAPARLAAVARAQGMAVIGVAREAVLNPAQYQLGCSTRAGLRRKLRKAMAAGITVTGPADAAPPPDLSALDAIAAAWAASHGGERGFSMGRFSRSYLRGQRLYVAYLQGRPVAFVTFHQGPTEWVLDLMRHHNNLPDGTMHLLIQTAIDDAIRLDLPRLTLAAAPETAFAGNALAHLPVLSHKGAEGAAGLMRFKSAFAPKWEKRYLAAPNPALLALAALEIARAIHHPPPLPGKAPSSVEDGAHMTKIEPVDAEYAFASVR